MNTGPRPEPNNGAFTTSHAVLAWEAAPCLCQYTLLTRGGGRPPAWRPAPEDFRIARTVSMIGLTYFFAQILFHIMLDAAGRIQLDEIAVYAELEAHGNTA
jgi:hypothetical protein